MQTVAEFITQKRHAAGLTKQELATALGAHWDTINKWEKGNRTPRGSRLAEIRDALGVRNRQPVHLQGHDGGAVILPPIVTGDEPLTLTVGRMLSRIEALEARVRQLECGE